MGHIFSKLWALPAALGPKSHRGGWGKLTLVGGKALMSSLAAVTLWEGVLCSCDRCAGSGVRLPVSGSCRNKTHHLSEEGRSSSPVAVKSLASAEMKATWRSPTPSTSRGTLVLHPQEGRAEPVEVRPGRPVRKAPGVTGREGFPQETSGLRFMARAGGKEGRQWRRERTHVSGR